MPRDTEFSKRVLMVVRRIPAGRVASYGDVAAAAGRPRAWRAVGNIMRTCNAAGVPCHRVIAAAGQLGGYGGNLGLKRALLAQEGVVVRGSRVRNWRVLRWPSPVAPPETSPAARASRTAGRRRTRDD
jgi:O-6-methylguanine DNA methyltransferase